MVGCLAGVGARLTARHIQQQQVAQVDQQLNNKHCISVSGPDSL